jgi:O-antigen ligase
MRNLDRISMGAASRERWILAAGFLYALSFQKYQSRDALSQSVGVQGIIEAGLVIVAFLIAFLQSRTTPRRFGVHPAICLFGVYGLFALASSIHSYDIKLSVVKGVLFFAVLISAYLIAEAQMTVTFLDGVYRGYIATLLAALAIGLAAPGKFPLFSNDEYTGRTRLALLATHPNSIGEVSGLLFLLAQVLPIRTPWYWQAFLFGISLLAGEKTCMAALVICGGLIFLFGHRTRTLANHWKAFGFAALLGCAALACVAAGVVPDSVGNVAGRAAASIYGKNVASEVSNLDGRADVWAKVADLSKDAIVLGFGFEGARQYLLQAVSWAGQAHNGFLQALLSAGLIGLLALVVGWFAAVRDMLTDDRAWSVRVLSLQLYVFFLAMIGAVFDSPSFFTIFVFVGVLYSGLEDKLRRRTGLPSPELEISTNLGFVRQELHGA